MKSCLSASKNNDLIASAAADWERSLAAYQSWSLLYRVFRLAGNSAPRPVEKTNINKFTNFDYIQKLAVHESGAMPPKPKTQLISQKRQILETKSRDAH
jgi:hypothetical protein